MRHIKTDLSGTLAAIKTFKLHRPTGGHYPIDAEALAAHFVRAHSAGATQEQITQAMETAIKGAPGNTTISRKPRLEQIVRMQVALGDAIAVLPSVQSRLGGDTPIPGTLTDSLRAMTVQEFCPKTLLHHGAEKLTKACGGMLRRLKREDQPENRL